MHKLIKISLAKIILYRMNRIFPRLKYLSPFLLIFLLSCSPEQDKHFTIRAKVNGLKDGTARLVKLDLESNQKVNLDSSKVINGIFSFSGKVHSPYLHSIFLNDSIGPIHVFLDNSEIQILGHIDSLQHINISGSREDSLFHSISMDAIFEKETGMDLMLNKNDYTFSAFVAYYQFQVNQIPLDSMILIMNGFTEKVKQSDYFRHVSSLYLTLEATATSKPAPDFTLPDVNGENISLSDFHGQTVLLDFWASWCGPCRKLSPDLVQLHDQFKGRNFTILSVSVDDHKDRWIKAIEEDQLDWTHVSKLDGWGDVSKMYGVMAIPQNFLISPDGNILSKNLTIEQLTEQLEHFLP